MWWQSLLIGAGSSFFGALAGWFFGRKRQRIDNIDAATKTFNNIIESLEEKINNLLEQAKKDAIKIAEMAAEIESLRQEIERLKADRQENVKLKKQVLRYEKLLQENNIVY